MASSREWLPSSDGDPKTEQVPPRQHDAAPAQYAQPNQFAQPNQYSQPPQYVHAAQSAPYPTSLPPRGVTTTPYPPHVGPTARRSSNLTRAIVLTVLLSAVLYASWESHQFNEAKKLREYQSTTFVEIPRTEPTGAEGAMPLADAEAFATSYTPSPDDNGSYVDASRELAHVFGAEIRWSPDLSSQACSPPEGSVQGFVAAICPLQPYIIEFNRDSFAMPMHLYSVELIDTVKHELSHHAIVMRCGYKWEPGDAGTSGEAITNSYAVLFMGADRAGLTAGLAPSDPYATSTNTDAAATRIHDGDCS